MLALLFFCFVAALVTAKWAIGKLMFRLRHERLVLFTASPILYLPGIPVVVFLIQGISENFSEAFYNESGDGHVVLGFNIVFLTAFVVALTAMLLLDGLLVERHVPAASGHVLSASSWIGLRRASAWVAIVLINLVMWFFWIGVYYAIQFPTELDFDG